MSKDIATNDELREHVLAWLRANDIDPANIPAEPYMSLAGDQLTTNVYVVNEQGKRQFILNEVAKTTATYTVTVPPPPDVAEWLRPRCPTCGR